MHVDLIGAYRKSTRQQQPGGAVIQKNASLTCMTIIDPATVCYKIVHIMTFDLDEVTTSNNEYIDKLSARVRHLFKNTWL